ncbi:MAG TPA: hypothetical protein PKC10_03135, partial [Cyclobacteriaceae bacterium]|nr:hypothetical protein [Cyclobacteriaceae bacterium]
LSGIAKEFVEHKKHAWVGEFQNTDSIYTGMQTLWSDLSLRNELIENGKQEVALRFELADMISKLQTVYHE